MALLYQDMNNMKYIGETSQRKEKKKLRDITAYHRGLLLRAPPLFLSLEKKRVIKDS